MIKIKDVTKKYGEATVLEHCSYDFPQNGVVCLLGASGTGKTTLLNLLAGFDTDYSGEILVGEESITKLDVNGLCNYRKDNTGFVFQNYHLLSGYTVLENVLLACELSADAAEISLQKAKALLEQLGLKEKENQKIETLSGGQKQRVAIARALVNNPQILFADEPTGALDRATSTEIMNLLKEISKEKIVIVITHDTKICSFADEIIYIKDKTITAEVSSLHKVTQEKTMIIKNSTKTSAINRAKKNFMVHIKRYIAVSIAISVGMLAFLFSLSFGNVMDSSIEDFKTKNTAFNNGYIKGIDSTQTLKELTDDDRIENVYYQYKLGKISLSMDDKAEIMTEKFPTAKAAEDLSYGVMPKRGSDEISLTPSLAKKFSADIKSLIGKELTVDIGDKTYRLQISGIYNAGYDDFFVSSDIEQKFYENLPKQDNYSISYDVKEFSDIVAVSDDLKLKGIDVASAAVEVGALQQTFDTLNKLFLVISILIFAIGLFICAVLLTKLQNTRYRELGLLSALGFSKGQITWIITDENILLSALATAVNLALLLCSVVACSIFNFPINITIVEICLSVAATFAIVLILSGIASNKLVKTEPAVALRK